MYYLVELIMIIIFVIASMVLFRSAIRAINFMITFVLIVLLSVGFCLCYSANLSWLGFAIMVYACMLIFVLLFKKSEQLVRIGKLEKYNVDATYFLCEAISISSIVFGLMIFEDYMRNEQSIAVLCVWIPLMLVGIYMSAFASVTYGDLNRWI